MTDQSFKILAQLLVDNVPSSAESRKAFEYYQSGFENQVDGKYAQAFSLYFQSLQLEKDSFARSYAYYNIGIIYLQLKKFWLV